MHQLLNQLLLYGVVVVRSLSEEVRTLKEVNAMQTDALRELTRLLLKSKPHQRPTISAERKLFIAGKAHFKCCNPYGSCPLYKLHDGSFDEHGFEIDHEIPFAKSFRSAGNCRALCPYCHALVSRFQRLQEIEEETEE